MAYEIFVFEEDPNDYIFRLRNMIENDTLTEMLLSAKTILSDVTIDHILVVLGDHILKYDQGSKIKRSDFFLEITQKLPISVCKSSGFTLNNFTI